MAKYWANLKKFGIGKKIFSGTFIWLQSQRSSSNALEVIASFSHTFGGCCMDFLVFLFFHFTPKDAQEPQSNIEVYVCFGESF